LNPYWLVPPGVPFTAANSAAACEFLFSYKYTFPNNAWAAPFEKRPASTAGTVAGKLGIASVRSFSICA